MDNKLQFGYTILGLVAIIDIVLNYDDLRDFVVSVQEWFKEHKDDFRALGGPVFWFVGLFLFWYIAISLGCGPSEALKEYINATP